MATVYRVRDVRNDQVLALKLLLPLEAREARSRFRREFRALSRLSHPNVLRVYEWGLWGDRPWFTMDLVVGHDLRGEVEYAKQLRPQARFERIESLLVQVARALAYIHGQGLVHRDVTPGNVMVTEDGHAVLMDFGVVRETGADLTSHGEVIGTVAYIAPEQISSSRVDARADLYSLGAVLYLLLTGQRPFKARTLQGYLEKHLNETPRPPSEVDPLVPQHLAQVCLRLLAKAPSDRFASANHLLHVLGAQQTVEDLDDAWPPMVGRGEILGALEEGINLLDQEDRGDALLLFGGSGQGKSRILERASRYARGLGLRVARGRCRLHDPPFGAFVTVFTELCEDLAPSEVPTVLTQAFSANSDQVSERYPVIAAFRDLVVQRAPCVIVLDDLQLADPATLELLQFLMRNTLELTATPVLYVLCREAETEEGQAWLAGLPVRTLEVAPLGAAQVEELVLSVLPATPETQVLAQRLHVEGEGSPAYVAEMLRSLLDEGLIVEENGQRRLVLEASEISRSQMPIPASLRAALRERLLPLPGDAIEVARTLAIARRKLSLDALVDAAPMAEDRVMDALDRLDAAGIVVESRRGEQELVELSHGRFVDVLLEGIDPHELAHRHQVLGEVIERTHRRNADEVVELLAWHFEQANLAPKAYAYLLRTAQRNLSRSLYAEGLGYLDRALALEPRARPLMVLDEADRRLCDVYLSRAQARNHLGQWTRAIADTRRALSLAEEVGEVHLLARVHSELGHQLRNAGDVTEAELALRTGLRYARQSGDETLQPNPLYLLGGLRWSQGHLDEAERLWSEASDIAERLGLDRELGRVENGLGLVAICRGELATARTHLERSSELLDRLGILGPLAITRVNLVELYLSSGTLRRALELSEQTVSQAREVAHTHGIALGLAYRAQVLLVIGRLDEAEENARESLRLVRGLGNHEDELLCLVVLMRLELARGNPDGSLVYYTEIQPLLAEYDAEGLAPMVHVHKAQALLAQGRDEQARRIMENTTVEPRRWAHLEVRLHLEAGDAWAGLGRATEARELAMKALELAEDSGYRLYQLRARQLLAKVDEGDEKRARHQRVAASLARSLAASLPRADGQRFVQDGWGA